MTDRINKTYDFEFPLTVTGDYTGAKQYQIVQHRVRDYDDRWEKYLREQFAFRSNTWKDFTVRVKTRMINKHHGVLKVHIYDNRIPDQIDTQLGDSMVTLDIVKGVLSNTWDETTEFFTEGSEFTENGLTYLDVQLDYFKAFRIQQAKDQLAKLENA